MNEWSRLTLVTAASSPAVTLAEAKKHLRVSWNDEDDIIQVYLNAAIATIEGPNGIGVALGQQTWRLSLDGFPWEIRLPLGPVSSVDSITYTNENGSDATVDSWREDLDQYPARLWPERNQSWPAAYCEPGSVKVQFTTGYQTIPGDLKAAVLLIVGHLYANREAVSDTAMSEVPMAVTSIIERYRVGRFA